MRIRAAGGGGGARGAGGEGGPLCVLSFLPLSFSLFPPHFPFPGRGGVFGGGGGGGEGGGKLPGWGGCALRGYPGGRHPRRLVGAWLPRLRGLRAGPSPGVFGYRGPSLGELGSPPAPVADLVEDQMAIKSEAELALLRESCKWANLAHTLLQRYTRPGVSETEVENRASNEATHAMLDAIGPIYRSRASGSKARSPATAARSAATPRSRTRCRTTSSSRPATCS